MTTLNMDETILRSMGRRSSVGSVTGIAHKFILNGAPRRLAILGIDVIGEMMCDWTVAILEEAINDPSRPPQVRFHALEKLVESLLHAIQRGYARVTPEGVRRLASESKKALEERLKGIYQADIQAVEDLCNHLSEAVDDGVFAPLPDF